MSNEHSALGQEEYVHGYTEEHRTFLSTRTAQREAAFFLPFLKPGMRLLDCGCGMGALTTSLAEWLAPGDVIGIDREDSQINAARDWARQKGVKNVRFETGSIYEIPYPDASFDAAFAYTVLEHTREPLQAIREMRRVLKPGGVIGLCDPDYEGQLWAPASPGLAELMQIMRRFSEEHASPYYARHQRGYLLEAGFSPTQGFAQAVGGGSDQMTPFMFRNIIKPTIETIRPWIVETGHATEEHIDELLTEMEAWSQKPDAFFGLMHCAAVGWAA